MCGACSRRMVSKTRNDAIIKPHRKVKNLPTEWIDAETNILLCEFGKRLAFVNLYLLHELLALFFLNHNAVLDVTGLHVTSVLNKIQFSATCLLILVRRFVR